MIDLWRKEIFKRRKYQDLPERYEYPLTDKGKDLYGPLIAMLRWGNDWLARGEVPLNSEAQELRQRLQSHCGLRPLPQATQS